MSKSADAPSGDRNNDKNRTPFDDITERLRNPNTPEYRGTTFLGFHDSKTRYPVLIPDKLWESGFWVLGAARSGKTQRVLASLTVQRMQRNDCPICVIDCKGDDGYFHTVREHARRLGRKLLILTNVPNFSTRLFNPLTQRGLAKLDRASVTEHFLTSLNLLHGFAYAKSFFSAQSIIGWNAAYVMKDSREAWGPLEGLSRATSFVQLTQRLRKVVKDYPEMRGAEALQMVLRQLSGQFVLNAGCCDIHPKAAVEAAIDMADLLARDESGTYPVLYCYLRAESSPITTSMNAKLVLNVLKFHQRQLLDKVAFGEVPGPAPVVAIFIDESQHVLDDAVRNILEQGASLGMQFVLANQDISQLRYGDRDFFQTVWENCGNKIILTARDTSFQEALMKASGEKATHHLQYTIDGWSLGRGKVDPQNAVDGVYKVAEMISPRWERNQIIEMSATPGRAMFIPAQNEALANYEGYPIMVDLPFVHSQARYEQLKGSQWPDQTPETVVPLKHMERWEDFLDKEFQPKRK